MSKIEEMARRVRNAQQALDVASDDRERMSVAYNAAVDAERAAESELEEARDALLEEAGKP